MFKIELVSIRTVDGSERVKYAKLAIKLFWNLNFLQPPIDPKKNENHAKYLSLIRINLTAWRKTIISLLSLEGVT